MSLRKFQSENKATVTRGNSFSAQLSELFILDGYNIRPIDFDYVSTIAQGYIAGDPIPAIIVEVVEVEGVNKLRVIDGHHRYHAAIEAKVAYVEVKEFKGNAEEAIALMFKSGSTRPLTQLDKAEGVRRLRNANLKQADVARILGITPQGVAALEKIIELPFRFKELVRENVISASQAVELFRVHGEKAVGLVESKLAQHESEQKQEVAPAVSKQVNGNGAEPAAAEEPVSTVEKVTRATLTAKAFKPAKLPKLAPTVVTSMQTAVQRIGMLIRIDDIGEGSDVTIKMDKATAVLLAQVAAELEDHTSEVAAIKAQIAADEAAMAKHAEEQESLDLVNEQLS